MKNDSKNLKTKYRVKLYSNFTEPYWFDENPIVDHILSDEFMLYDYIIFRKIVDDFIDAPNEKMTDKDVRKQFDDAKRKLSDTKVKVIKTYYNGRFELKKRIDADLAKVDIKKIKKDFPVILKYGIPFEMNYFSMEDNDPNDSKTRLNDGYIEIEISKNEAI